MNEQLEDLRGRAKFHAMDEKRIYERMHNCEQSMEEYLEVYDTKLAELILLECVDICEQQRLKILNNPNDPSWTEHLADAQNNIKQHFGLDNKCS